MTCVGVSRFGCVSGVCDVPMRLERLVTLVELAYALALAGLLLMATVVAAGLMAFAAPPQPTRRAAGHRAG